MEQLYNSFSVDIAEKTLPQIVHVKQNDDARGIAVSLTKNGESYTIPTGCIYVARLRRADGKAVILEARLENSVLYVDFITDALSVPGKAAGDVAIYTQDGKTLSSFIFILDVTQSAATGHDITKHEEYDLIQKLLKEVAEAAKAETEHALAELARAQAETDRTAAEAARETAEATRAAEEAKRAKAETARAQAEAARATAEADRVRVEGTRTQAETARDAAETERANADAARAAEETKRTQAEAARDAAETERANAEAARATEETKRTQAEAARADAETARANAEAARVQAEIARVNECSGLVLAYQEAIQLIDQARKDAEIVESFAELVESFSDELFSTFMDDTNTSEIFRRWYALNNDGVATKYDLLSRFFTMCAVGNDQQHTLRFYTAEASSATAGTPLDWLADKQAAPLATDTNDPGEGWDEENRLTWWIMGNALKKEDGTLDVLYIEGEDGFDITGELAPVYTFQMCPYFREEVTEEYEIRSWRATPAPGYRAWETGLDGKKRAMVWHPSFDGGFTTNGGKLTSGAGRHAAIFNSASQGLTAARKWNAYEGTWGDSDTKWLLYEWQHRHFNKENSGILEGCSNYNYQYKAALGEENTTRVLLSTASGANIIPGSCVLVGEMGKNTRWERSNAYMRNLSGGAVKVLARNTVTVNGAQYSEIVLDLAAPITTTKTTCVSTIAWDTGSTLGLPKHRDGSIGSLTNGRYPLRVAGIEAMLGCYAIGLDPLYRTTANAGGGYDYEIFECKNAKNQESSITANYVNTGLSYSGFPSGWQYVKKFKATDKAILFPDEIGGSSTGYYKSAFYGTEGASVLCPWRFANLNHMGRAGIAAGNGYFDPSGSGWSGVPRLTGSGAMRGE